MLDFLPVILASTYTKEDFLRRTNILRKYLETVHFSKKKISLSDFLNDKEISKEDSQAIASWGISPTGEFTRTGMYDAIKRLTETIESMNTLTLFVPFEPNRDSVQTLGSWARNNISKDTIIDIRLDPEAAGGVKIAWNGKYVDYSMTRLIHMHRENIYRLMDEKMGKKK